MAKERKLIDRYLELLELRLTLARRRFFALTGSDNLVNNRQRKWRSEMKKKGLHNGTK